MKTGPNPAVIYPKKTKNLRVKFLKNFRPKSGSFFLKKFCFIYVYKKGSLSTAFNSITANM
jgi:hypothetical protein